METEGKTPRIKRWMLVAGAGILLALLVPIGLAVYVRSKPLEIEFFENIVIDLHESADTHQFVKRIENGIILTEKTQIDTESLGTQEIALTVKPAFGAEKVFLYTVTVVDRECPRISFPAHSETELGKEIDLLKGVRVTDNSGETITATVEGSYDLQTVGDYSLKYVAMDSSANKTEEPFTLSVVDRESPVITAPEFLETTVGTEIDLLADVSASDNSGEKITVTVEGNYDFNRAGVYELKYAASDSSGNRAESSLILQINEPPPPPAPAPKPEPEKKPGKEVTVLFTTSKGFQGVRKDGVTYIDGYLIANKSYSLPQSYGNGLTSETKAAFNTMAAAAKAEGLNIYISSGFRSYSTQKSLYKRYVKRDGVEKADTYSARPGNSEHQSGLAFDVNIISSAFIGTPEAIWLHDNCYKYGFILRYPEGKTNETGYIYEPWHFRYVGVELATTLYNGGDWITMEDYFGITSVYP